MLRLREIANRIQRGVVCIVVLVTGIGLGASALAESRGAGPRQAGGRLHQGAGPQQADLRLLTGYWQNYPNGDGFIRLREVSSQFDVVNIAFARSVSGSTSTIDFKVNPLESESQFISDVAFLRGLGKKVVVSIGSGVNLVVKLNTSTDVQNFVNSVRSMVNKFGFDGIDIDFEASSLTLGAGDTDFRNPTTPAIVNLISALRQLKGMFGPGFVLSLAPGTAGVQSGFKSYGGNTGNYLPVIFGIRDILSYVQVQDYGSGPRLALDGNTYTGGTADFHVAMTEMLLRGFPVAGNPGLVFPPLRPDQVVFGVAADQTAMGFTTNSDLKYALQYLINGVSFGGRYRLRSPAGYAGLRGLMTWSINWDAAYGFSLSDEMGPYIHGLGSRQQGPVISGASATRKNLVVSGYGFDDGAVITVNGQDQKTVNDDASPATTLVGIKLIKRATIVPGQTVMLQVRNSDASLSNEIAYTRPDE